MARAAKVPQNYHAFIAALQRHIPLTAKDPRMSPAEKEAIAAAVNTITLAMTKASAKPLPKL